GKGTAFKIYLPIAKEAAEEIRPIIPQPPIGGTETLLVAEDDGEVRRLTKVLLEEFGYRVIEAVDGEDAIRRFIENRGEVSLIILDVIMPRKNGREAYEEILKTAPLVKALFLSGYTEDTILKKGILEKGFNFLSKPVSPTSLLKKIREIIDGTDPAR
ncbi:MAG: response regulator, partial [Deltaproteobacteria bacterium]|nr:response regulator [Deltaproteobacteria bacterium]